MATWQQGINSGGFLAGIGGQNSNAPKASDVSEALAYIRQNNEMERSGRNNIGLQALQGLGSVAQTYQAAKQQEADAAFQKEYAAAIQSGDRQQVRDLMTKYLTCRSLVRSLITRRFQNFNPIVMSLFAMLVLMVR